MDIERGPVVNDIILRRGHCYYAHFWMFAKEIVADAWPAAGLIERDDHEIRPGPIHALDNLRVVGHFTDDLNVSLIRKSRENCFAHEPRAVCHKDTYSFFHRALPAAQVSGSRAIGVRIKSS